MKKIKLNGCTMLDIGVLFVYLFTGNIYIIHSVYARHCSRSQDIAVNKQTPLTCRAHIIVSKIDSKQIYSHGKG